MLSAQRDLTSARHIGRRSEMFAMACRIQIIVMNIRRGREPASRTSVAQRQDPPLTQQCAALQGPEKGAEVANTSEGSRGGGRRAFSSALRRSSMALASASSAVSPGSSRATRASSISAARFRSLRSRRRRAVSRRATGSKLPDTLQQHVCRPVASRSHAGCILVLSMGIGHATFMQERAGAALVHAG